MKPVKTWQGSNRVTTPEYRRNRPVVMRRDKGLCIRCEVLFDRIIAAVEVDHIQPQSRGGGDELCNLQALCFSCHKIKTDREKNGKQGFGPRVGVDGWRIFSDDAKLTKEVKRRTENIGNRIE